MDVLQRVPFLPSPVRVMGEENPLPRLPSGTIFSAVGGNVPGMCMYVLSVLVPYEATVQDAAMSN